MDKIRFFIDFDGTITTTDVVDRVLDRFARKEWKTVEKDWVEGRIGSRECLSRQIDFVVTTESDLMKLIEEIQIDPHFISFLREAKRLSVPVFIVSDGFDLFIEHILNKSLKDFPELLASLPVFCNKLYWTGKGLKAIFANRGCDHGCANCKPAVIKKNALAGEKIVFVGDGLSARFAAEIAGQEAGLTFAKGKLLNYCEEKNIRHEKYSSFKEIEEWIIRHSERSEESHSENKLMRSFGSASG